MKIAHTADIHIRPLSRHEEYRLAFKAFNESCRSEGVDHIFVGGDIFHTKTTGISPEYIDLLTWWLIDMASICQVHMILGNHDGNLLNSNRQDAISPVVNAINNPNIHLYKDSGVYHFAPGFTFCVFSPFDENTWDAVIPDPDCINIAAYHGPVWGCYTETDWQIEDGVNNSFFDRFEFGFLGDIHKRQTIRYRNGTQSVAYPGTLIQQNYAEQFDHGYLLWDIKNKNEWTVKFIEIENTCPFITIDWDDIQVDFLKNKRYKKFRLRVRHDRHIPQKDIQEFIQREKSLGAIEVIFKNDQVINKDIVTTVGNVIVEKNDLTQHEVLFPLIKDYHLLSDVSIHTWDNVSLLLRSYLNQVVNTIRVPRNTKWSINELWFDNMFAYGKENYINFKKLNGVVGIFAPNRSGKSSIIGTLMYGLFNSSDRGSIKNAHLCNVRKPYCLTKVQFDVNGIDYLVERQTVKSETKKGKINSSTSLNFYKGGEDNTGEQRNDTEKKVRELIGTPEDFLFTSFSSQGEINYFLEQGSTKRKQLLTKFLDLGIFEMIYDLASKDVSSFNSALKTLPQHDLSSEIVELSIKKNELKKSVENNILEIKALRDGILKHREELSTIGSTYYTETDLRKAESSVDLVKSEILEIEKRVLLTKNEYNEKLEKLQKAEDVLLKTNLDDLEKKNELFQSLKSDISSLRLTIDNTKKAQDRNEKTFKILETVPCGDSFPTCRFIKDAHEIKDELPKTKNVIKGLTHKLTGLVSSYEEFLSEKTSEKIVKIRKIEELVSKLNVEIKSLFEKEATLHERLNFFNSEKLSNCINHYEKVKGALNESDNAERVRLTGKINDISTKIETLESVKMSSINQIGSLESKISTKTETLEKINELLDSLRATEFITSAFSKKGVPSFIVSSQLPVINRELSNILSGIVNFAVELEIDESDSLEIYINYGDSRRIIELGSGMEKMITSIALRVALINISSLPKTDIFIIDEGFGSLDDLSIEACNRLLSSLKQYFRVIIVITHVDSVKDSVDSFIEITKNGIDSRIYHE